MHVVVNAGFEWLTRTAERRCSLRTFGEDRLVKVTWYVRGEGRR